MAKIDNDGVLQLKQHIMEPMKNIYNKLDGKQFETIRDEFQHVVDYINNLEKKWMIDDSENVQVIINGKAYKPSDN